MSEKRSFIALDPRFTAMIERLVGEEAPVFLEALDADAATSIFYNTRKQKGVRPFIAEPVPWCSDGGFLTHRPSFTLDPLFHGGAYYVMEASSMFLSHVLRASGLDTCPVTALDLCGAPGGKSVILVSSLAQGSLLVTNETNRSRWHVLQHNMDKWGYSNVVRMSADPSAIRGTAMFDLILVDAPCSGEGLFRKDMEARRQWSPDHIQLCSGRQRRILKEAARMLRPGGVLIYTTCTFNDMENIDQVAWLAAEHGFESLPVAIEPRWGVDMVEKEGQRGYRFFPHQVRGEGFFCSVLTSPGGMSESGTAGHAKPKPYRGQKELMGLAEKWMEWNTAEGSVHVTRSGQDRISVLLTSMDISFLDGMRGCCWGTEIGQLKGDVFTPAHALALSNHVSSSVPDLALDLEEAVAFLRKKPVRAKMRYEGWYLARYQGLALGWLKQTKAGPRNYLPTNLRIIQGS